MSGGKHTPGPWTTLKSKGLSDGQHDFAINAGKHLVVAEAFGRDSRGNIVAAEANARLIASAPDLLEALQLMLEQFTKTPSTLKDSEARIKAHAALSRATGSKS